tara:strand:+ start:121 stop:441 length:321 start_codon:yes stop_codon:yes gene_type:complete
MFNEPTVLGDFTLELDANPGRDGGRADQILYIAFGLGWLELEITGDEMKVIACHKEHPHDGAEIFKMNVENGETRLWAEYYGEGDEDEDEDEGIEEERRMWKVSDE